MGGFRELVEDHGAGRLVAPGDPRRAGDGDRRAARPIRRSASELAGAPGRRPPGPYSWDSVARRTLALYEEVLAG